MNEAQDQLEAELAALRPHDASPDLRQRIADHRDHSLPPRSRWLWGLTLASGLAAACVVLTILLHLGGSRHGAPDQTIVGVHAEPSFKGRGRWASFSGVPARPRPDHPTNSMPCSTSTPCPAPELVRVCTFTRSNVALLALLGEN